MESEWGAILGRSQMTVDVHVGDPIVALIENRHGSGQQLHGIGILPLGLVRGKVPPDITRCRRTEESVHDGVGHGVTVGVSGKARVIRDLDATQHQRTGRVEAM